MLRVSLSQARPGMTLALPVLHPERPGTVLLRGGVEIRSSVIGRLRQLHVPELWIRYPRLERVADSINPGAMRAHAVLMRELGDDFERLLAGADTRLEYSRYRPAVSSLVDQLTAKPDACSYMYELLTGPRELLTHSANVCMLSLLMGLKLEFYLVRERARLSAMHARDVTSLGVGAMLHDIGMIRASGVDCGCWDVDGCSDDPEWRRHVQVGYDMVKGEVEPAAASVVLNHHQRYDGTGFPAGGGGVSGTDIHVFARVAAAADIYDRLHRFGGPDGGPVPAVRALRMLREPPCCRWIDPVVMAGLLSVVPPYPAGSVVRLNNGMTGVVSSWTPLDPCRPTVEVLGGPEFDPTKGEPDSAGEPVDLRETTELYIDFADGQPVGADNFYPESPDEFDLSATARRQANRADALRNAS